jgi:hypothetical protein
VQAQQICSLISTIAKGGPGMVAIAGQWLNVVLEDLKLNKNLKVNRVTQSITVGPGSYGPFPLEADYLRTYDLWFPLQNPNGQTQFLNPVTMEQWDAEFKASPTADYPYEFATDLSTQAQAALASVVNGTVTGVQTTSSGLGYLTVPTVTISDNDSTGTGAAATATLKAVSVQGNGGTGYLVNDIVTVTGGTFTRPAQLQWFGGVTTWIVLDGGSYSIVPGSPALFGTTNITGIGGSIIVTGGHGSALNPFIAWGVGDITVTSVGQNYGDPTVAFFGGSPVPTSATATATAGTTTSTSAGNLFIFPSSSVPITLTHRYMVNQPDITNPETSTATPWFPYTEYLIHKAAGLMMGITGDDREAQFLKEAEDMLRPHLIMEGDEQQTVRGIRLDPRHFRSTRSVRPTKVNPY